MFIYTACIYYQSLDRLSVTFLYLANYFDFYQKFIFEFHYERLSIICNRSKKAFVNSNNVRQKYFNKIFIKQFIDRI